MAPEPNAAPSATPRPTGTPRSTPRVGSAQPSRAGSTLRRLPPRNQVTKPPPPRVEPPISKCPNPECTDPQVQEVDGQQTCINCGATVPDSNIVSEVTFGESASGAAVVQGGFVGEGQRYAKTMGPAFKRGGMATDSREITEGQGREEIRKLANFLNITNDALIEAGARIYRIAVMHRFIIGRRVRTVAAVCLYCACRRLAAKDNRFPPILLIDFAEAIRVNVFRLGEVFQAMRKQMLIDVDDSDEAHGRIPNIEVEKLIQRYAAKLEFGNKTLKVANDACTIIRRMKRDWIVTGRQPAGLCGACIILAARMNNFRRTIREVVYVVKAADITVGKRIEEFKRTDSSALSVESFRDNALRLKKQHDPPVLYETRMKQLKKRRLREMYEGPRGNPDQIDGQASTADGPEESPNKLRRDAEGFAIPAKPVAVDPALTTAEVGRGRTTEADDGARTPSRSPSPGPFKNAAKARKARQKATPKRKKMTVMERPEMKILTANDLTDERALEHEIEVRLTDQELNEQFGDVQFNYYADRAKKAADEVRTVERERKRQEDEKRRQEAGLVIEINDDDSENESDADENEQQPLENNATQRSRRQISKSPATKPNARDRSATAEPPPTTGGLLTPATTQSQSYRASPSQRSPTPGEPMMSGALPTPDASQAEAANSDTQQPAAREDSPDLIIRTLTGDHSTTASPNPKKRKRPLGRWDISSDPEISPSEFDDDPEVKYCRLSEADTRVKERIWVTHNEEWLRDQQRKQLRRAMIEAQGPKRRGSSAPADGEQHEPIEWYGGRPKRKKKRSKMGDGSIVEEGGKPQSAAEAAVRMVQKRGKGFSRWVNRTALDDHMRDLYTVNRSGRSSVDPTSASGSGSAGDGSRRESEAPSEAARDESTAADATRGEEEQSRAGTQEPAGKQKQALSVSEEQANDETNEDAAQPDEQQEDENEDEGDEAEDEVEDGLEDLAAEYDDAKVQYDDDEEIGFEGDEDYD